MFAIHEGRSDKQCASTESMSPFFKNPFTFTAIVFISSIGVAPIKVGSPACKVCSGCKVNESHVSIALEITRTLSFSSLFKRNNCTKIEPGIQAGDNEVHIFSCWLHTVFNIVSSHGEINPCSVAEKGNWSDIWEGNVTRNKM